MSNQFLSLQDEKVLNADRQLVILEEWLAAMESVVPTPALRSKLWICVAFLKSSRRAYAHLRTGWQRDSSWVAWGCRSLLELSIFARFVVRSPSDLQRFIDDAVVDSSQSADALLRLADKTFPASSCLDDEKESLLTKVDVLLNKSGYEGKSYLSATALAKEMGIDDSVHDIYKICSKLIHPTAQSILLIDEEDQHERDLLVVFGANYFIDLMHDFVPLMRTLEKGSAEGNAV